MALKFRERDYRFEEETARWCLPPRAPAQSHPLASVSESAGTEPFLKVHSDGYHDTAAKDPLGVHCDLFVKPDDPLREDTLPETADYVDSDFHKTQSDEIIQHSTKEWVIFTKTLTQKFSHSSMVNTSLANGILPRNPKENERFSKVTNQREMDRSEKEMEEENKILTKEDYISRLKELKAEICRAWNNEDRNTSLKLSIKVVNFLCDTSVFQFYPMIFVLVTEILDMLGELVWDRIKKKAEWTDDGKYTCALPDDFVPGDISFDAKELCCNWFSKIGSIRQLLPRIYLELAILRCWRFLKENLLSDLQRLTMMMRGLSDPMASAYCHLYMVHCVQGLNDGDTGYLVTSVNDINIKLRRIMMEREGKDTNPGLNKRYLITLLEPALEWIMRAMLRAEKQKVHEALINLGLLKSASHLKETVPFLSVVTHYLLKELPGDIVLKYALELLELIECSVDVSFEQHMNFRLLGLRFSESQPSVHHLSIITKKIFPIIRHYDVLGEYLDVLEAYLDIILQNTEESSVSSILDGVLKRVESQVLTDNGMNVLLSIIMKIIDKSSFLENVLAQKNFIQCFDLLNGVPHSTAGRCILHKATRNSFINDTRTIEFLFEVSRTLHDAVNFSNSKESEYATAKLICHFIRKVVFPEEMDANLQFLVECRLAFRNFNEIKVYLVHSSNALVMKAIHNVVMSADFVKACIAFSEASIPSVLDRSQCFNLYLETAEVALSAGFISHAEENIFSAVKCFESENLDKGANAPDDTSWMMPSLLKLCGVLVMVPCINVEGACRIPQILLSAIGSQPWSSVMARVKIQCAIIFILTTLLQKELPYRSCNPNLVGNDVLFSGDESYKQALVLTSTLAAEELVETIEQCSGPTDLLGRLALDVCNCLATSFQASEKLSSMCLQMINVSQSCLHSQDKYLQSTVAFLSQRLSIDG